MPLGAAMATEAFASPRGKVAVIGGVRSTVRITSWRWLMGELEGGWGCSLELTQNPIVCDCGDKNISGPVDADGGPSHITGLKCLTSVNFTISLLPPSLPPPIHPSLSFMRKIG